MFFVSAWMRSFKSHHLEIPINVSQPAGLCSRYAKISRAGVDKHAGAFGLDATQMLLPFSTGHASALAAHRPPAPSPALYGCFVGFCHADLFPTRRSISQ